MKRFTEILDQAAARREPVVLCTIVDTSGSTPLKAGSKMLVWEDGKTAGTVGGGNLEKRVIDEAGEILKAGVGKLNEYHLLREEMCCGGTVKIFMEPVKPQNQLVIFGGGHIGSHIAYYAHKLDFRIIVADERADLLERIESPGAELIGMHHRQAFSKISFDRSTYVVICTHLHEYDREILAWCIHQPVAYVGMIGSRRKIIVTRKRFLEQKIAKPAELDRVDMPMGLDIGQHSPAEIALGILAKIAAVSNGKKIIQLDEKEHPAVSGEIIPEECTTKPIKQSA